jgi:hypothetical protein
MEISWQKMALELQAIHTTNEGWWNSQSLEVNEQSSEVNEQSSEVNEQSAKWFGPFFSYDYIVGFRLLIKIKEAFSLDAVIKSFHLLCLSQAYHISWKHPSY